MCAGFYAYKIIMGSLKRGENKDYTYQDVLKQRVFTEKHKDGVIGYHLIKNTLVSAVLDNQNLTKQGRFYVYF